MPELLTTYLVWFDPRLNDWYACLPTDLSQKAKTKLNAEGIAVLPVMAEGQKSAIASCKNNDTRHTVH